MSLQMQWPQNPSVRSVWGAGVRERGEFGRLPGLQRGLGTLNLELHRFLRRLGYAQLINRAGTQGSSRTGLGNHSLTHLPKCFVLTTDCAAPELLLLDVSDKL